MKKIKNVFCYFSLFEKLSYTPLMCPIGQQKQIFVFSYLTNVKMTKIIFVLMECIRF